MKANEFIKKYGIYSAKRLVETAPLDKRETPNIKYEKGNAHWGGSSLDICVDVQELKRLIESHELVEKMGGLNEAKGEFFEIVHSGYYVDVSPSALRKAIADVESCQ